MHKFKIRKGRYEPTYEITKKNYLYHCQNQEKYSIQVGKTTQPIALCPICDNTIQLIGIFKEQRRYINGKETIIRPYGRHVVKRDTQLGKFNEETYLNCPLSSKYSSTKSGSEYYAKPTHLNLYACQMIYENFDIAMYVLAKSMGLQYISDINAKRILDWYISSEGYLYKDTNLYNLPWMLFSASHRNLKLWGLRILEDSELYKYLKTRKDIILEKEQSINVYTVKSIGRITDCLEFGVYKRYADQDEELCEKVQMRIFQTDENDDSHTVWQTYLDVSLTEFVNLCNFVKDNPERWHRNQKLLDYAHEKISPILEKMKGSVNDA